MNVLKTLNTKIIEELLKKISAEIDNASSTYKGFKDHATSPDLKSEGKYDTRAVEAGYLASAQKVRVDELMQDKKLIEEIPHTIHVKGEVGIGSVVKLALNSNSKLYFISPTSGGTMLSLDGQIILVVSVFSPLGEAMIGLKSGDDFEVVINENSRSYKILEVY